MSKIDEKADKVEIDWEQVRAEQEKAQEYAEWNRKHGWKNPKYGTCKVCQGRVVGLVGNGSTMVGGLPEWRHLGYHCQSCGLKYHFAPEPHGKMTKEEIEQHNRGWK